MNRIARIAAAYLLVPLVPPILLMLASDFGRRSIGDWAGIILIYWPFGFATIIALGTPLLLLLQFLGWTGFLPFMTGAAVCAGIVSYLVQPDVSRFFAGAGAFSGLAFRIMLYGFGTAPFKGFMAIRSRAVQIALAYVSALFAVAFLFGLYSISDSHRTVRERMGWQCTGIQDTPDPKYPHIESAKFWFLKNPNYEEDASGPHLCADLQAAGNQPVSMIFHVWGNRVRGLHGYNETRIEIGAKPVTTYSFASGGGHGGPSRFPLDVFR